MNIQIKWARNKALCRYCDKHVESQEALLIWHRWNKLKGWTYKWYYHPHCWVEERLFYLNDYPKPLFVGHGGGRKPLDLPDETKIARRKLIQVYSKWKHRHDETGERKRGEIRAKMKDLGGIPYSWG